MNGSSLQAAIEAGDTLAVARHYLAVGLSPIPIHCDGSKRPKFAAWNQYGDTPPTEVELIQWFGRGPKAGIGICGGPASGNLTVLDFETADIWNRWLALVPADHLPHLHACPLARTPGGGAHLYIRLGITTRTITYAERYNETNQIKTLIETRAHGQQVLAPGCPRECHPLHRPYYWERMAWIGDGKSFTVPIEVYHTWTEFAASLTEVTREIHTTKRGACRETSSHTHTSDDPGTDFNHRGTWEETGLFSAGWELVRDYGDDRGAVRRPGKSEGTSGTLGVANSSTNHWPLFHCFTSNGHPFEAGGNYDRFGVYTRLQHDGDFKAASKKLRELGYGKQDRPPPAIEWRKCTNSPTRGRGFKWASELASQEKANDWIWEGYLPRGGITLLSALWKVGKTTLLSHLLKSCGGGGEFLGKPLKASRVLYVSEEGERHWVRRRDSLQLADNVGFYLQPFATRPAFDNWRGFIQQIVADAQTHGFDLVVFDTLAKLWPVLEENDAGAVDGALMPLWEISRAGAGVLLIHHLRKSGGDEYTGSRGSGALSAFPDILVELKRFDSKDAKCRKRVLKAKGRYEETPDELVIELINGLYAVVPDVPTEPVPVLRSSGGDCPHLLPSQPESSPEACEQQIITVLRESPTLWMQSEQIRDELTRRGWGMRYEDVATYLASLYQRNQVVIGGRLRSKKSPRVFALTSRSAPGSRGNEIIGNEMKNGDLFDDRDQE